MNTVPGLLKSFQLVPLLLVHVGRILATFCPVELYSIWTYFGDVFLGPIDCLLYRTPHDSINEEAGGVAGKI